MDASGNHTGQRLTDKTDRSSVGLFPTGGDVTWSPLPAPTIEDAAASQDRLVSELRLRTVSTRAAANAFLPEFLADFNRRFAQPRPDSIRPLPSWPPRSPSSRRGPIPGVGPTIRASPSTPATPSDGDDIFTLQYPRHSIDQRQGTRPCCPVC
jgi:hypothetical protein